MPAPLLSLKMRMQSRFRVTTSGSHRRPIGFGGDMDGFGDLNSQHTNWFNMCAK